MTITDTDRHTDRHLTLLDAGWHMPDAWPGPVHDPEEGTPAERIRAVAASGFASLAIPEAFGGAGADLAGTAAAQRALARRDPHAAIALNMHSLTVGLMTDYWERHRDTTSWLLEGIATQNALVASAFAEPGGSANFLSSVSTARREGRGYVVSGTKYPCSLASTATLVCLSARVAGTDDTIIALCPSASPGLRVEGDWPSLGMNASDTAKLVLDEVEIDDRLVFHRAPADSIDDTVIAGIVWFAVLIGATYHGVLTSLLDLAVKTVTTSDRHGPRTVRIGQAARDLLALGGACRQLARDWTDGSLGGEPALATAMALRSSLSDTRDRVVSTLTPVIGSRMYTRGQHAAALHLDSLAAHHHPPSLLACDEAVGAYCTGRPLGFDPSS
ncbi:oxidoreductase [Streptomyces griseoloalbus]|uniref:acyl-CoA dehydrogenase family protein n=1 Tax=Streptomyces griseoloalbus TaxID=67303 RepID=UPI0018742C62|nr:oxidoreductase [Streptomyces griseoloalbus]